MIDFLFFDPKPAPDPGAHSFVVQFTPDGQIGFQGATDDPDALAGRVRRLLQLFGEIPELVDAACGIPGAARVVPGVAYLGRGEVVRADPL